MALAENGSIEEARAYQEYHDKLKAEKEEESKRKQEEFERQEQEREQKRQKKLGRNLNRQNIISEKRKLLRMI